MLSEQCKQALRDEAKKSFGLPAIVVNTIIERFEPILKKHYTANKVPFVDEQKTLPMVVKYKNRVPDPGPCVVIMVNWETKQLEVSNGTVRLYPSFDEVIVIKQ